MTDLFSSNSAVISPCGRYRYRLEREGVGDGSTLVVMVNPSTADADNDDATIRKLRGFGERNRWGRIIVANLFAYRATDVRLLATAPDPIGPENDAHLKQMIEGADRLIFAWGPVAKLPKRLRSRWQSVRNMAQISDKQPLCIGSPAKDGHPRHPLMLAYAEPIKRWPAIADTHPKDGDVKQAPLVSGGGAEGNRPNTIAQSQPLGNPLDTGDGK